MSEPSVVLFVLFFYFFLLFRFSFGRARARATRVARRVVRGCGGVCGRIGLKFGKSWRLLEFASAVVAGGPYHGTQPWFGRFT